MSLKEKLQFLRYKKEIKNQQFSVDYSDYMKKS